MPITDTGGFATQRFEFGIAMGVRKGEHAFRDELNGVLERLRAVIDQLLDAYGVPRVEHAAAEAPDVAGAERRGATGMAE